MHDHHPQFMSDEEVKRLFRVYRDRYAEIAEHTLHQVHLHVQELWPGGRCIARPRPFPGHRPPHRAGSDKEQSGLDYGRASRKSPGSPRAILGSAHTVAIAPFASCYTYEAWVIPKRKRRNLAEMTDEERDDFAVAARDVLARLSKLLSDPPYNYAFVQSVDDDVHMHLRIYPKLGTEAGFELNTRVHINSVTPESAAKSLREI